jgi:NADH-quinone oxidoreductase subunit E
VYGVATFYNQFRFQPLGRYHVQVCRGTACHVKGSLQTLNAIQRTLQVTPGQTTRDGVFSLEVVACLGACGLAPLMAVNGEFHAGATSERAAKILRVLKREAAGR